MRARVRVCAFIRFVTLRSTYVRCPLAVCKHCVVTSNVAPLLRCTHCVGERSDAVAYSPKKYYFV